MSTPLPVLAGTYYARIKGTFGSRPSSCVFTLTKDGVPLGDGSDGPNAQAVSNALSAHWHTLADLAFHSAYAATEVATYPLGSPLLPQFSALCTATGGISGSSAPVSTAALIKHTVLRRGRGSQSRSFLSPLGASVVSTDGSVISDAYAGELTTAFTTFMSSAIVDIEAAVGGLWNYVQLSKHPTGRTFEILSSQAETALSTQRRRAQRP